MFANWLLPFLRDAWNVFDLVVVGGPTPRARAKTRMKEVAQGKKSHKSLAPSLVRPPAQSDTRTIHALRNSLSLMEGKRAKGVGGGGARWRRTRRQTGRG